MNRRERRKAMREGKPIPDVSPKEEVFEARNGRRYLRMENGELRRVAEWRKNRKRKANDGLQT